MAMKLSRLTIGFGAYIVISASFMLQVNLWLAAKVGTPFLHGCFWAASFIILIAAVAYALRARFGKWNDFITNVLGGILGIGLFLALKKRR